MSVVARQGRLEEAETLYARALDLLRGEDAELTVFTLCNVAYLYSSNGCQTAPLKFMRTSPPCDRKKLAFWSKSMSQFRELGPGQLGA